MPTISGRVLGRRWRGSSGNARRRYQDALLAAFVVLIIGMMIIPLPAALLDVLIASNIAIGVLMLMVGMMVPNGLAFTAMPTVLLVTTLYRLALNISSTRLILLQAYAGEVIRSFGEFVVRGDYVVGAVIFFILTVVQYLVVARGAERVAEVGARFTLDAMPGRQMAIDGDLRSGALSVRQAQQRRDDLQRESQFYGAMDGAMRFVKGDAVAGIIITGVNIVAGVGIGTLMRDLELGESLRIYGLLTVGDGLVSQIPSLLISTSAGVVVTRVASEQRDRSLGADIGVQLFGNPRLLGMAAVFFAFLAVVPGLPAAPFLVLAALLGVLARVMSETGRRRRGVSGVVLGAAETERGDGGEQAAAMSLPEVAPIGLELGQGLGRQLFEGDGAPGALETDIAEMRQRLFCDLGIVLPPVSTRVSAQLEPFGYAVLLRELPAGQGEIRADNVSARELLLRALETAVRGRTQDLVGLQEVQTMLEQLERSHPALVRAVVPAAVSLPLLTDVLHRLAEEKLSVRPLREILEALSVNAPLESDPAALTERVRASLNRHITLRYAKSGMLAVHQVDPSIEEAIRDGIQRHGLGHDGVQHESGWRRDGGRPQQAPRTSLALPPDQARDIIQAVARACADPEAGDPPIVLTQTDTRRFLRCLIAAELPDVVVLSHPELAPEVAVKPLGPVTVGEL